MNLLDKIKSRLSGVEKPEHLRRGEIGEQAAKRHLQKLGLKFLTANFNSDRGEVDLIFRDGECLVFVLKKICVSSYEFNQLALIVNLRVSMGLTEIHDESFILDNKYQQAYFSFMHRYALINLGLLIRCLRLTILGFTTVIFAVGCANTFYFKVVDAKTQKPLKGVSAQSVQICTQMFQKIRQEGPVNFPLSKQDGIIRCVGLHPWWNSQFIFSCPGYQNVYGDYGDYSSRLIVSDHAKFYPTGQWQDRLILDGGLTNMFVLDGKQTIINKSNGYYLIEMQK